MTDDGTEVVAPLPSGSLGLGPYRILREIGTGGMGTVYLAEVAESVEGAFGPLPSAGTRVALKCFHPHLVSSEDFEGRFRREARIGARLRHENVVHTLDAGCDDLRGHPTSYLAMELVEGQTLRELIADLGRVPEELAVTIAQQVLAGLDAIHGAGITHRDLKPENVIITGDQHVKLMDLGVAKVRDASIRLSLTGQFLGSVHYAAPEQFRDTTAVDARADLYAVGVLLHEMLTGGNPFYHSDLQVVLRRTLTETPARIATLVPDVSPVVDQLAACLLAKDPDGRLSSAAEVADVLVRGEDSSWWQGGARTAWERSGTRRTRRLAVERETALVGRDQELAELRNVFDRVAGGERHVVLLEGEAGVGKTRLVDEFAASLAAAGIDHELVFATFPLTGTGRPDETVSEALLQLCEGMDVRERLSTLLPEGTPLDAFAALVEGRAHGGEPLSRDVSRALFAECFRAAARERPLLLVVEDAHLAGESAISLLASLARDDAGAAVLVIVTHQPVEDGHALSVLAQALRPPRMHQVRLGRLGPREVGQLLRAMLQSERLVQELGFRLIEKTEGNPYFMFEVLRSLKQENVLRRRSDGSWTMSGTRVDIHVPDSVRELLHGVLGRLSDEDRDLLDVACVAGVEFDPDLVGEVLGVARLPLLRRLSQMERRHRLIRSTGRTCRFDHPQLRETLYEELMPPLREEYHALLGGALASRLGEAGPTGPQAMELAHHLLQGRRLQDALPLVRPALRQGLAAYATEATTALARRFLDLDEADGGRSADAALRTEVLLALAECLAHEGMRDEERDVLERAADEVAGADDAELRSRTLERRLSLHFSLGELARAETVCRDALRAAARSKDRPAAIAALANLAGAMRGQGRFDEAVNALRRALSWVVPEGSHVRRCLLTTSLGMVQAHRGHVDSAQRLYAQARSLAEGFGLREGPPVSRRPPAAGDELYAQFQGLARALGRYAESRIDAARVLLLATDCAQPAREAAALFALGLLAGELEQLRGARAALHAAHDKATEAGDLRFASAALQALGENAVQAGDDARARQRFGEALEVRRSIGYRPGTCESLLALGQVEAMAGDVGGARARLDEALELAPALELPGIAALGRATAALLYARDGRRDRAREQLDEAHAALGGESALSVASRAEGLYFAARAAEALGDADAARAYMWQAYDLVQEMAERMTPAQRHAFLTGSSPNREIVAAVAD